MIVRPRLCLVYPTFIWIALLVILKDFFYNNNEEKKTKEVRQKSEFKDLFLKNVRTYHWVCVENVPFDLKKTNGSELSGSWRTKTKSYQLPLRVCQLPRKRITVYNYRGNISFGKGSIFGFKARFTPVPISYEKYDLQETAYFHTFKEPFEPENFFHLTKQFLFPLHYVIKATGQLGDKFRNVAFFQKSLSRCPGRVKLPFSAKTGRYKILFEMLGIYNHDQVSLYPDKVYPARTCYKNAVFSRGMHGEHALDAIKFIQEKLDIKTINCPKRVLTIITRKKYRRILNINQLTQIATDMGYNVQAVALEKFTLAEQAQMIYCTEILVGVTGAGLQWAYFMRNHSGVVEIAWPKCDWLFFFSGDKNYNSEESHIRPLKIVQLGNVTCKRNLKAFKMYLEDVFYVKRNFTIQETLEMYQDKTNYHFHDYMASTLGKLFDVFVDPTSFRQAIMQAKPGYA